MHVAVLGGRGTVGRVAVAELLARGADRVTVYDAAAEPAFDDARIAAGDLDGTDPPSLERALDGVDCAANCLPFEHNAAATEAAVAAGTDLVDCGGYGEAALNEQFAHDDAARDAGMTVVAGLGLSPGLSNVIATHAADDLDAVESVEICWVSRRPLTTSPGLLRTAIAEQVGPRVQYLDGERVEKPAFSGRRAVEYPFADEGVVSHYYPHPEPMTLPDHLDASTVTVRGSYGNRNGRRLQSLHEAGLLADEPTVDGRSPRAFVTELLAARASEVEDAGDVGESLIAMRVDVTGEAGPNRVERTYRAPTTLRASALDYPFPSTPVGVATGVPVACGALAVADGVTQGAGVRPPEAVLDPDAFLTSLGATGSGVDVVVEERQRRETRLA